MPHLYISAAHKSAGKTICSVAITAALRQQGLRLQTFKKGPDYIDPLWLGHASGRDCHNLDFHTMLDDEICDLFVSTDEAADFSLIEGNKGLHDSVDAQGKFSNASLAMLLGAPVILVIDTRGMTRGVAAILRGLVEFEPAVRFAGVILNQVGGERHAGKLRAAIENYTDLSVLGVLPRHDSLVIPAAHLGLVPANENGQSARVVAAMAGLARDHLDLHRIVAAGGHAREPSAPAHGVDDPPRSHSLRLGVARDEAFGFYYPGDLASLENAGAQLVNIDTLRDPNLPDVDGLFLGGGFPERHMHALEANRSLRRDIRVAIEDGLAVYAECGGLMYLSRQLAWGDERAEMVGALSLDIVMHDRPQGRGYVHLRETPHAPWPHVNNEHAEIEGSEVRAHEFHYSQVCNVAMDLRFAYEVTRGHGVDGHHDGIVYKNTLASYSHLRATRQNQWTRRFIAHVDRCRQTRQSRSETGRARGAFDVQDH